MQSAMIRMGKLPRWRFRHGANEGLFTSEKTGVPEWLRLIVTAVNIFSARSVIAAAAKEKD